MTIKTFLSFFLVLTSFILAPLAFSNPLGGQAMQISTHFHSVEGSPSWLLILRDVSTGEVFPYVFDVKNNDNYWVAFTKGHSYRVTVSSLTFGPYAKIKNLCNLEDGVLNGQSLNVTMTGVLSPDPHQFRCRIMRY